MHCMYYKDTVQIVRMSDLSVITLLNVMNIK